MSKIVINGVDGNFGSLVAKYALKLMNKEDLVFTGLNSSGNVTENESEIKSYMIGDGSSNSKNVYPKLGLAGSPDGFNYLWRDLYDCQRRNAKICATFWIYNLASWRFYDFVLAHCSIFFNRKN